MLARGGPAVGVPLEGRRGRSVGMLVGRVGAAERFVSETEVRP